jgi:excisionase family DNA binding protein
MDMMLSSRKSAVTPEYLSIEELACYSGLSTSTLRRRLQDDMPHYRVGRSIRVKRSEFDTWLKQFQASSSTDTHPLDAAWQEVMEEVCS